MKSKDTPSVTGSGESSAGPSPCDLPAGTQLDLFGPPPSPASPGAPLGGRRGRKTKGTSGRSSSDSSAGACPTPSSGNRSGAASDGDGCEESQATSSGSATTSPSSASPPQGQEPPTSAIDFFGEPIGEQRCRKCKSIKPFSEFYKSNLWVNGYRGICKVCYRARVRDWRRKPGSREKTAATFSNYRRQKRIRALLSAAKYRSRLKGISFDMPPEEVDRLQGILDQGLCQVTGLPFDLDGGKTWNSPSIDRIDSSQGYVVGNVRVVLYCVNVMANVWGEDKIAEIAQAMRTMRRKPSNDLQARLEGKLKATISLDCSPEYTLQWGERYSPGGLRIPILKARARRPASTLSEQALLSGWPTCKSTDGDNGLRSPEGAEAEFRCKGTGADLPTVANLAGWPTPEAGAFGTADVERLQARREEVKARHGNGNGFGLTLHQACLLWLSPSTSGPSSPSTGSESRGGLDPKPSESTPSLAGWATPTAQDGSNARNETAQRSTEGHHGGQTLVDLVEGLPLAGWGTPSATDGKGDSPANRDRADGRLRTQAAQTGGLPLAGWATPKATESSASAESTEARAARARLKYEAGEYGANSGPPSMNDLNYQARLTAPGTTTESSPAGTGSTGGLVLNPAHSRFLMQFPEMWDLCSPSWKSWELVQAALAGLSARPEKTESAGSAPTETP